MKNEEKIKAIATFRFGVIADFVTGARFTYGEKESLLKKKVSRRYEIPFSKKSSLARSTIVGWINEYRSAGCRIEGLYPKTRSDEGKCRKLSEESRLAVKALRKEKPSLTIPALLRELKYQKRLPENQECSLSSIYRFLRNEGLQSVNEDAQDKRLFEAQYPNQIWQSDVMHGPQAYVNQKMRKSYLIAILDDHSRLIIHAEFYPTEGIDNLKHCLKSGIQVRGLPQKLYIDNGSCYRAINLEHITASLGIAITHSRPYTPQGRGKIERWFRFVQDDFLPQYRKIEPLNKLNEMFESWVDGYNNREHSTTGETPYFRFKKNLECIRYAPPDLINHFRMVESRRVKKDRTFRLNGQLYEAPVTLIDRRVELKYHPEEIEKVEVFFNQISYGFSQIVNPHINGQVGRNWSSLKDQKPEARSDADVSTIAIVPKNGQLFIGGEQ